MGYECRLASCYSIQFGLGAYNNTQLFNPSPLTSLGGYIIPRFAWWSGRWHLGADANFAIAKVSGDTKQSLFFFDNDKRTHSGIIAPSLFAGVNLGTLQSPLFLDILSFIHFNIYDQNTHTIQNGYYYVGLQLSHIAYMHNFWNLEWGLGYGYMLLGFYDIDNSANIPYPHTIPTRVHSQPNHLLKAYMSLTMTRNYYVRFNMMYLSPQDSHHFMAYNENVKFSHRGNIMLGLEFGWNLRYE